MLLADDPPVVGQRSADGFHGVVEGDVADAVTVAPVEEGESLVRQERVLDVGQADADERQVLPVDLGDLLERSGDLAGFGGDEIVELVDGEEDSGATIGVGRLDEGVKELLVGGLAVWGVDPTGAPAEHGDGYTG